MVIIAGVISSDSPLYFALKSKKELCDLISVGGNAKILFLYIITPTVISLPFISSSTSASLSSKKHFFNAFIISFLFSILDIPKLDPPLFGLIKSGNFICFIILSRLIASFFFINLTY